MQEVTLNFHHHHRHHHGGDNTTTVVTDPNAQQAPAPDPNAQQAPPQPPAQDPNAQQAPPQPPVQDPNAQQDSSNATGNIAKPQAKAPAKTQAKQPTEPGMWERHKGGFIGAGIMVVLFVAGLVCYFVTKEKGTEA